MSQPFTIESIERIERETAASLVFGTPSSSRSGVVAKLRTQDGDLYHVSLRDGGGAWHIDGLVRAGCAMPVFMHGPFSVMSHSVFGDLDDIAQLEAAAAALEVPGDLELAGRYQALIETRLAADGCYGCHGSGVMPTGHACLHHHPDCEPGMCVAGCEHLEA